jgi:hypothetical protein
MIPEAAEMSNAIDARQRQRIAAGVRSQESEVRGKKDFEAN